MVGVRVSFAEEEVREQIKQAKEKWNRRHKVWEMRYAHMVALKLEARIVEGKASNSKSRAERQSIYIWMPR